MTSEDDSVKHRYYDAEKIKEQFSKVFPRPRFFRRALGTAKRPLNDMSGFFISLALVPIVFAFPLLIIAGLVYGYWVFLLGASLVIVGTGYMVNRSVGKSIQFENTRFVRRLLAVAIAFALTLGLLGVIIFLARLVP